MKTFFSSTRDPHNINGGAGDMLGGAGRNALGAVATGLMVNNPQEMSRVTRLLFDMVFSFFFFSFFFVSFFFFDLWCASCSTWSFPSCLLFFSSFLVDFVLSRAEHETHALQWF